MAGANVMLRNRLELWFRKQPPADLASALLQTASEDFLVCRMNWPAIEVDTTREGLKELVDSHRGYRCEAGEGHIYMGHGCLIVVPRQVAILIWNHAGATPYRGFVPVTKDGLGYYLVPSYGRLDHPSHRTIRTDDTIYVARRDAGAN